MAKVARIGLGSNLGDRRSMLESAVEAIAAISGGRLVAVSSFVETPPVGGPPGQGPFLNAAASLETERSPHDLLAELRAIEGRMGRQRVVRWGERTLDLDLLLMDDVEILTTDLELPHPRMCVRPFVLDPLAEIAPDAIEPLTGRSILSLGDHLRQRPPALAVLGERGAAEDWVRWLEEDLRPTGWRVWSGDLEIEPTFAAVIARRYDLEKIARARWRTALDLPERFSPDRPPEVPVLWLDGDRRDEELRDLAAICRGIRDATAERPDPPRT